MKKKFVITAVFCLVFLGAYSQDWQTSPTSMATGSQYSSNITPVGAGNVNNTDNDGPTTTSAPRRAFERPGEANQSEEFPIGEPWALALLASAAAGVIATRKQKTNK